VYTTAEGSLGYLRLNCADIGIVNQVWATSPYTTSGPATNSSGQCTVQDIIPLDYTVAGKNTLSFDVAPGTTVTTGRVSTVGVQYADSMPPQDWCDSYPYPVGMKGAGVTSAQVLTTTRTTLGAITIPAWVNEIVACRAAFLKTGAITAGQAVSGFVDFESTIPAIAPQKIPTNALGATLGTPVGTGLYHEGIPWIPMYIKGTGQSETITPYANLRAAVSTGNSCFVSVAWR
jgi:hypothetical protein